MNLPHWQREIEDLHVFFENWLGGVFAQDGAAFERLEQALAPSFVIINPEGTESTRDPLITGLYKGHGSRSGLRIQIKNPSLRFENDNVIVATYEEWQDYAETSTARLSTVIFEKLGAEGLRWLHVHETWLANGKPNR